MSDRTDDTATIKAVLDEHPEHHVYREVAKGVWQPGIPIHPRGRLGRRVRRACHKAGGHWWHPQDGTGVALWACCSCGVEREGFPKDGSR